MTHVKDAERIRFEASRLRGDLEERARRSRLAHAGRRDRASQLGLAAANETKLAAVQAAAHELAAGRDRLELLRAEIDLWRERNAEHRNLDTGTIASRLAYFAVPFGIAIIDTLLLGAAGRELAKTLKPLTDNFDAVLPLALFSISIAYITLELGVGERIGRAGDGSPAGGGFRAFAVLAWLAMPFAVVSFALAGSGMLTPEHGKQLGAASRTVGSITIALQGLLALATHGFVLFFGARIIDGAGFVLYESKERIMRLRRARLIDRVGGAGSAVESTFRAYYNELDRQRMELADAQPSIGPPSPGPFSTRTREIVNDVFGEELIEAPAGPRRERKRNTKSGDDAVEPEAGEDPSGADDHEGAGPEEWDLGGEDEL